MVRDPTSYSFRYVNVPISGKHKSDKRTSENSEYLEMRSSSPGTPEGCNPDEIEMKPMLTQAGSSTKKKKKCCARIFNKHQLNHYQFVFQFQKGMVI